MSQNNISENQWKLPLYKVYTDDEDVNLITKIIKRGTRWAIGPEIEEFENQIKNYVGTDYCLTLNSGTSALHSLLLAHNIQKDDEVIVPSFSFIATANSVLFVGGKPIFSDIEEETFGLDPTKISQKISNKTKAVIPMDYGGSPCKIYEIKKICDDNNIKIIEDAAEGLGSSINGRKTGSVADSSIFSFCGNKVLTTGEGGAIVTNSKEIFEKVKLIRSHGRVDVGNYFDNTGDSNYEMFGFNWRMSSITAVLGISQLQKLDKLIKMRQDNANYISSRLSNIQDIITPTTPDGFVSIFQMYTIRLQNKNIRTQLQDFLKKNQIFSKVYFQPIHSTSFYKTNFNSDDNDLEITKKISEQVLTLPMYPNMSMEEKDLLINTIKEFFENRN